MEIRRGIRGALAAGLLLGAAAGLARRRRTTRQEPGREPRQGRCLTVTTGDGVRLAVEVDEASEPKAAVVFAHGWVLNRGCWFPQREALAGEAILVCYDQRGHGASSAGAYDCCTVDRLAEDLETVVEEVVPPELPVVLVGHSMGGMTVMGLAARRPELFGDRIRGVALLGTSCGGLAGSTFGLRGPLGRAVPRMTPLVLERMLARAPLIDRSAALKRGVNWPVTRYLAFGPGARREHVSLVNGMVAATPTEVMVGFFHGIMAHDKADALHALASVETLVMVGARDRLTPPSHAHRIAQALPGARLIVVPGAGHMLGLERPEVVNRTLAELVGKALKEPMPPGEPKAA
ncbi:alpha/beta fold hydrolase [Thermoactinospora rubra]|uniref:alpha/beta fold hydrolase n=1 Tax=Thermoactinospora rubra TaxID=1088767 RepID=UPI000A0F78B6|nr:alpha/beta hydrolase [Thermoactinospora rubra]